MIDTEPNKCLLSSKFMAFFALNVNVHQVKWENIETVSGIIVSLYKETHTNRN